MLPKWHKECTKKMAFVSDLKSTTSVRTKPTSQSLFLKRKFPEFCSGSIIVVNVLKRSCM